MNKRTHKECGGEIIEFPPTPEMGDSPALWMRYLCKKCKEEFSQSRIDQVIEPVADK